MYSIPPFYEQLSNIKLKEVEFYAYAYGTFRQTNPTAWAPCPGLPETEQAHCCAPCSVSV